MSIITPMTDEDVFLKISACFLPVYQVIRDEFIQPTERLVFVTECTRHEFKSREGISLGKMIMQEDTISKQVTYVENSMSLVVLTDKRWLRMSLDEFEYSRRIRITHHKSFVGRWLAGEQYKFEWYFPPKEIRVYRKDLSLDQYIANQVKAVLLTEVQVTGRSESTIENRTNTPLNQLHLLRIDLGTLVSYSFLQNDGVHIHKLIQLSSVNSGRVPLAIKSSSTPDKEGLLSDHVEKLRQLKQLLDEGLITESEYELKRQEVLSRM